MNLSLILQSKDLIFKNPYKEIKMDLRSKNWDTKWKVTFPLSIKVCKKNLKKLKSLKKYNINNNTKNNKVSLFQKFNQSKSQDMNILMIQIKKNNIIILQITDTIKLKNLLKIAEFLISNKADLRTL